MAEHDGQEEQSESVRTVSVPSARPGSPKEDLGVDSPPAFPEGGVQAWATVAGALLIQFCGFGYTTSFDFYTRDYLTQSSSSAISWIGSVNALLVISSGLLAGRLYDRGHLCAVFSPPKDLSSFVIQLSSTIRRMPPSILQPFRALPILPTPTDTKFTQIFLAQGLGAGLGAGAVYVPSGAVVSHHFQRRRALAMSIVASGSSLGAVVHPIMLNNTFHRLGFANAVRASAGLVSGLLLIACKSLRRFARDNAYIFATVGLSIYTAGFYFPLFYLQLDAVTHGINQTLSFYSLVIMNASSFVGRLAPGFFARKLGVINMVVAASGCGAVLILSMIALKSIASVVVIGVFYGFSAGVFVTMMAPLLAVLTEDLGELGLRMGVSFAVVGIGGLIGPPINGALLTSHFVWWRPALFSGVRAYLPSPFLISRSWC
ncbi:major facilitator superfamily domain-containing protein [Mycena vulgaris]|nr:major facilitator superfamily domain-containing protein [Mycena vulgaris]